MKDLSLGIHTFADIIDGNFVYVDKTDFIYNLIRPTKGYYFLSRPRRFGKSLLVSTLKAIFEGKRELFKGLWLTEQSDYPFDAYPVLNFDFSQDKFADAQQLEEYLIYQVDQFAAAHQIELEYPHYAGRFGELIRQLGQEKPVVVLIDEYDKPLLDHLTTPQRDDIKEVLKGFYTAIKASDPYLRFVLLTGVTKFSKISVFSGLNNLTDLSMNERYAEMLGLTQAEIESYFPQRLQALAEKSGLSYQQTLDKIKLWYDGYRFSDKESYVYNPYSTLRLLDDQAFKFHWFETGTPTFLLDLIKNTPSSWRQIPEEKWATAQEFDSYEVEHLRPLPLLFQTGYLTIQEVDNSLMETMYRLDFPNFEVKNGFLSHLVKQFSGVYEESSHLFRLIRAFQAGEIEAVLEELKIFFANIEYDLHLKYEKYYQTIFFAIFQLLGFNIKTEVKTNKGRIDAIVDMPDTLYLFEFKLFDTAKAALQQIKTEQYFQKFLALDKPIVMVGVAFDAEEKNIGQWLIERRP